MRLDVFVSTLDTEADGSVPLGSRRSAGRRAHHGLQAGKTKGGAQRNSTNQPLLAL